MQYAEGIGNYIYIIFAVIYVIYSIVKAGKKVSQNRPKQSSQPAPPASSQPAETYSPPPQKEDDLKKMLEDLLGEIPEVKIPEKQQSLPKSQPVFSKPAPAKVAPRHPKKDKSATSSAKPLTAEKSTISETPNFVSHPEVIQKAFQENPVEDEASLDFDIWQAVIYSEILKRPQY